MVKHVLSVHKEGPGSHCRLQNNSQRRSSSQVMNVVDGLEEQEGQDGGSTKVD